MKEIRNVPGFRSVESLLSKSLQITQRGIQFHITAAQQLATQLIEDCIPDESLQKLLGVPTQTKDMLPQLQFSLLPEVPTMSLLEQILFIGITQSQSPTNTGVLSALIEIKKIELEKIGYQPTINSEKRFRYSSNIRLVSSIFIGQIVRPGPMSTNSHSSAGLTRNFLQIKCLLSSKKITSSPLLR